MSNAQEDFQGLLQRVRDRSDTAAAELVQQYGGQLRQVVRRSLPRKVRAQFDSLDLTQDVWAAFFAGLRRKQHFPTPAHLAAYLARIALNKVTDVTRACLFYELRNLQRQCSLDDSRLVEKEMLVARQETPSQIAMTEEKWQEYVDKQPLVHRHVLKRYRAGRTFGQIAMELGLTERTVRRVIERLRLDLLP